MKRMSFFNKNSNDFKLRISIEGAQNLAVADANGLSDPYAVLLIDNKKYGKTVVNKKTLHPVWNLHTNIPLHADKPHHLIEIFVWDKDRLRDAKLKDIITVNKEVIGDDFLGKISIPVGQLFDLVNPSGKALEYDSPQNADVTIPLEKRNHQDNVSGELHLRIGIIKGPDCGNRDIAKFWEDYINQ
ncbi:C2 domain-containing protein [Thamnidium elegans]|nr:C2 domain-containing protein [Thamnidium elegans]